MRPDWGTYFLAIAAVVSTRADCTRRKVGAVLVDERHRIISTGYNGTLPGQPGCLSGACPRGRLSHEECPPYSAYGNCIAVHAEENAIAYAHPSELPGATLYITDKPCDDCRELLASVGIIHIFWPSGQ